MAKLERTDKPVSVLLEELQKGELRLPEIQRSYVWNRPQARDLIDSLYREYPSGLILLWKPEELPILREGSLKGDDEREPNFLVLDGQQRLTSLQHVFMGKIDVYFNVEEELFQIYSSKLKSNPVWVSVNVVVTKGALEVLDRLEEILTLDKDLRKTYGQRLERLARIKEYRYPVMIIHTGDYEEVTESFIRINSRGTRLREAELAMAQLALNWPGSLVNSFESALADYEQANFSFEARFLMRCFVAIATNQSRFRYLGSLWKKDQADLEDIWKRTKKAVDYTINFLRNNVGIESSDWLPSVNALIPLVVFLSKIDGQLSEKETDGLLLWFLAATMHGRFTGSPETKLDQDLRAIDSQKPLEAMLANIKRDVSDLEITPEMVEGKYQRNPILLLMFIVFRHHRARDWFTGTMLSATNVGPDHQLELHHIFPRGVLKDAKRYETAEIDDIGNIAFLTQKANRKILMSMPVDYLSKIEEQRLQVQLVPLGKDKWEVDDYPQFLNERRNLIAETVNNFMEELENKSGLRI
jgi:hypothetical protein